MIRPILPDLHNSEETAPSMAPKTNEDRRTKHAVFVLDQVVALGIPLTFNVNDVASNLGLSVNGARSRIREVKKHNPGLKLSLTSAGKSSAGPPDSSRAGAVGSTPRSSPAVETRSSRPRSKRTDDDGAITRDEKRTTRSSSRVHRRNASDNDEDNSSNEQEAGQEAPRTRAGRRSAGRRSAGLEDVEEMSLPIHAPKGRHAASIKAKKRVQKEEEVGIATSREEEEAEGFGEDINQEPVVSDAALDQDALARDNMGDSGTISSEPFVQRLLDGTSDDVSGGVKRKRSVLPQTPSPTISWTTLKSDDLMPSSDLSSILRSREEEKRAAADAQEDTPSKPPPAKKTKLEVADAAAVQQVADGISKLAAVAEAPVVGAVADVWLGMEVDGINDYSASGRRPTSVSSPIVAEQVLELEGEDQVSQRDSVESVETGASDEKGFIQEIAQEIQGVEEAEAGRKDTEDDRVNARESTSPVDKPVETHTTEERSQFFTDPLKWMSYSREARPAAPSKAFEASADDKCRPYLQRQD